MRIATMRWPSGGRLVFEAVSVAACAAVGLAACWVACPRRSAVARHTAAIQISIGFGPPRWLCIITQSEKKG